MVTYDTAAVKHRLYAANPRMMFGLQYTAQGRYEGREVMFLSERLRVPDEWTSGREVVLCQPTRSYRGVYGKMENVMPHTEMKEGPAALDRFQKAMKAIVSVQKGPSGTPASKPKATTVKKASAKKQ